ncbi:MAG TPA: hypothetical protein VMY41_04955 [Thermohalobaculum sp.]|nr:hypothetical protein [Thermohalobaculum sp.]
MAPRNMPAAARRLVTARRPRRFLARIAVQFITQAIALIGWTNPAQAHASEQAFVLLLPTDFYTAIGVAAVAITAVALIFIPQSALHRLFSSWAIPRAAISFPLSADALATTTSALAFMALLLLIAIGLFGSYDPLANPLPLFIWTLWWIGFVLLQAVLGDIWRYANPWTGPYRILLEHRNPTGFQSLSKRVAHWPAVVAFLLFALFMLADPAPEDPARLAKIVGAYWLYTFAGMALFGAEAWLGRCECFTILFRQFAMLSFIGRASGRLRVGVPGWQIPDAPARAISASFLVLMALGTSSFDGLNETFWWLGKIDVNPLEYPGRSAVFWQTVSGAIISNGLFILSYSVCVYLGLALIGEAPRFAEGFGRLALSVAPIALAYHFAHYLTTFMVNAQYALAAASDPWATGADYLGLGRYYVTTGFLNTAQTVRVIWLAQAGAVVIGHMLAILVAHGTALKMLGSNKKAIISQTPLAMFMIAYTLFGLWLLSTPRGG